MLCRLREIIIVNMERKIKILVLGTIRILNRSRVVKLFERVTNNFHPHPLFSKCSIFKFLTVSKE